MILRPVIIGGYTYYLSSSIDEEEKRIVARLRQYGIRPTFNKTTDKAKLHMIELKEAQQLNYISGKFITLSKAEQEKIQEKKTTLRKEINPELDIKKKLKKDELKIEKAKKDATKNKTGATALGEQIWLSIKMKQPKK